MAARHPVPRKAVVATSCAAWLTCLLLLAGCATSPYPADWAPPLHGTGTDCAGVPGRFENIGRWDNGDPIAMAHLLFPVQLSEPGMLNYERFAVTSVSIAFRDETTLDIEAWVRDELLFERQLAGEEFECLQGQLALHTSSWGLNSVMFLPVVYRTSVEHLLSRAEDGALIVENHELSGGAVAVVPIGAKARYWFRFEPSPAARAPADVARLPRGVRAQSTPAQVLRPPDDAPDWSGHGRAKECLKQASDDSETPVLADASLLKGRSTQAFVLQNIDGVLVPNGIVRGRDWLPATHELRVEKQHREPPELTDRYVLCLLAKGYRWDDA